MSSHHSVLKPALSVMGVGVKSLVLQRVEGVCVSGDGPVYLSWAGIASFPYSASGYCPVAGLTPLYVLDL